MIGRCHRKKTGHKEVCPQLSIYLSVDREHSANCFFSFFVTITLGYVFFVLCVRAVYFTGSACRGHKGRNGPLSEREGDKNLRKGRE